MNRVWPPLFAILGLCACASDGEVQEENSDDVMASENQLNANGAGGEEADFDDVSESPAESNLGQTNVTKSPNTLSQGINPLTDTVDAAINPAAPTQGQGLGANQALGANQESGSNQAFGVANSSGAVSNAAVTPAVNVGGVTQAPVSQSVASVVQSQSQSKNATTAQSNLTDDVAKPRLHWVGYDYLEKEGIVRIEMVTVGKPKFNFFQEVNKAGQPELVIRFVGAGMRHKIRRDIDAREFKSPVAFIRLRKNVDDVDVVMTMRDAVKPRLYTKSGHVMLTFALPDRYFGNNTIGDAPVGQAQLLAAANLMPDLVRGSDQLEGPATPKPFINDPGASVFSDTPANAGSPVDPAAIPQAAPSLATPAVALPATQAMPAGSAAPATLTAPSTALPPQPAQGQPQLIPVAPMVAPPVMMMPMSQPAMPMGQPVMPMGQPVMPMGQPAMPMTVPPTQMPPPAAPPVNGGTKENDDSKLEDFDDGKGNSSETIDKFDVRSRSKHQIDEQDDEQDDGLVIIEAVTLVGVAQDEIPAANAPALPANNAAAPANNAPANNAPANANLNANAAAKAALANGAANLNAQNITNANAANIEANLANQAAANPANAPKNAANANAPANGNLTKDAPPVNLGGGAPPANAAADELLAEPPAAPAAPVVQAPMTPEPALEGTPDLAGEETEGVSAQAMPETPSLGGRPITLKELKLEAANLHSVILELGKMSNINFVIGPGVPNPKIDIHMQNVAFNDALNAVLASHQLTVVSLGPNLYRIDAAKTISDERDAEQKRRLAELEMTPTRILVHRLSFALADDVVKLLETMIKKNGKNNVPIVVQSDKRTNSIIVNAPTGDLSTVKALIERLDLETPQVRIATRIVELKKDNQKNFGISWGVPLNFDQGRGLGFGNLVFPNSMLSKFTIDAGGATKRIGSSNIFFGSANNSMALDLALSAEEVKNTAEVLQSSSLIVGDNEKATIVAGSTDFFAPPPVIGGGGVPGPGGQADNQVEYNLTVKVTPHITADGAVQMELDVKSDTPAPAKSALARAARTNRQVTTKMIRRSGETAVIGGIYNNERSKSQKGIPILSSIPIIGALFRNSESTDEKRELMVMVTPTVITTAKTFETPPSNDAATPVPASQEFTAPVPPNNAPATVSGGQNAPANAGGNNGGGNLNQQANTTNNGGGNFAGGLNGN